MSNLEEVGLTLRAKDATGPGIESARKNIGKLQDDFVNKAAKALAAIGTVEAGFKGLAGAASLLAGDTENAMRAFEGLPFGIGPAIGAVRMFAEALSGTSQVTKESIELIERLRTALSERADTLRLDGLEGIDRQVEELRQRTNAQIRELTSKAIEAHNQAGKEMVKGEKRVAEQLLQLQKEYEEAAEWLRSGFAGKRDALIDAHNKQRIERDRKNLEDWQREQKQAQDAALKQQADFIAMNGAIQQEGVAEWEAALAQMDAASERAAQLQAQRAAQFAGLIRQQLDPGGATRLSGGEQSRFLTGTAESRQQMLILEQTKATQQVADSVKAIEALLTNGVGRQALDVAFGLFGGPRPV